MKLLGEEWQGDVRVRWHYDDASQEIAVSHHQDVQSVVDQVAAINAEGAQTLDGLGKPVVEVPVVEAMAWARQRGIPWEKLLYSNEYDSEFKRFAQEYSRLRYESRKTVFALS